MAPLTAIDMLRMRSELGMSIKHFSDTLGIHAHTYRNIRDGAPLRKVIQRALLQMYREKTGRDYVSA